MRPAAFASVLLVFGLRALATELPPEGRCPGARAAGASAEVDATHAPLRSGDVIEHAALLRVRDLLPPEIWRHRDAFFFDGMRLTIGACHRRYAASAAFEEATRANAGNARLDADANLPAHAAGLPFPPASIDAGAPDAGARWEWNLERRYRGAGPRGSFRLLDLADARALASRTTAQLFSGEFFFAQTARRADLANGRDRAGRNADWVAGGAFREPGDARDLAWRQYRARESATDSRRADDVSCICPICERCAARRARAAMECSCRATAPRARATRA
ncbi:MAG: DUF1329 domain-containing protein [Deltaproteobacteria bacterium]|nr:DUF1329 domain-containing protein [Deltaproteobacteria bacterium]